MQIDVWRNKSGITVNCQMRAKKPGVSFALAESMKVDEIWLDSRRICFSTELFEESPLPQPTVKIALENETPGNLSVRYHGELTGVFRYDRPDLLHLSFYNAWYPFSFDVDTDCQIRVHLDDSWEAAYGIYDTEAKAWLIPGIELLPQITDCNVLMIKKDAYGALENGSVTVFFEPEYREMAERVFVFFSNVQQYYVKLYGIDRIGKTTIAYLPRMDEWSGDAYSRNGLIVFGHEPEDLPDQRHTFAHEMGHAYGTGADVFSWEDWLNETVAEWSALLYESEYDPDLFEVQIRKHEQKCEPSGLSLRPIGDERPDEVHSVGTLIWYEIYKVYGGDAIAELLRTYDALREKNTDALINRLVVNGKSYLADVIKKHLIQTDGSYKEGELYEADD